MSNNTPRANSEKDLVFEGHLYHQAATKRYVTKAEAYAWISIALMFSIGALIYVMDGWIDSPALRNFIFFFLLCFAAWNLVTNLKLIGTKDRIHGKLKGVIRITDEEMVIKKVPYPLAEITTLNFRVSDYSGRVKAHTLETEPMRSNGTSNFISFSYRNTLYEVQFLIQVKSQLEDLRELQRMIANKWPNTGLAPPKSKPFFDFDL